MSDDRRTLPTASTARQMCLLRLPFEVESDIALCLPMRPLLQLRRVHRRSHRQCHSTVAEAIIDDFSQECHAEEEDGSTFLFFVLRPRFEAAQQFTRFVQLTRMAPYLLGCLLGPNDRCDVSLRGMGAVMALLGDAAATSDATPFPQVTKLQFPKESATQAAHLLRLRIRWFQPPT